MIRPLHSSFSVSMLLTATLFFGCSTTKRTIELRSYPVRIENLGAVVNSDRDDFSPRITANGAFMYFTSDRQRSTSRGHRDFWYTSFDGNFWTLPENLGAPINTAHAEGTASITADGQQIFFATCEHEGVQRCDIFTATLVGKVWKDVRALGPPVNSSEWESQPSITSDGRTLYFVSDRKGGFGGLDIWRSTCDPNGLWSKPVNLGPKINTSGDEVSPFIASDGRTLYFATDSLPGMGGTDLFVSREIATGWTEPVNLGTPLNSAGNDEFFSLTAQGNIVYFSSARAGGFGGYDLYRAEPNPFPPGAVAVVSGTVRDKKTKVPLAANLTLADRTKRERLGVFTSNAYTGEYLIVLPAGVHYELTVEAPQYQTESETFDLMNKEVYEEIKRDFLLRKDEPAPKLAASVTADVLTSDFSILKARNAPTAGLTIEEVVYREFVPLLNYIFFEKGAAALPERYKTISQEHRDRFNPSKPEANTLEYYRNILNIFGQRLRAYPEASVTLIGCNDNEGVEKGNITLSRQRADAVQRYFTDIWGIDQKRITIQATNLPMNKSTSTTEEGREENRRVEIQSTDARLFAPVEINDVQRVIKPQSVIFNLSIEAQAGLRDWKFAVMQGERELRSSDGYSTYPDSVRWDWRDLQGNLPKGDEQMTFTLHARDVADAEVKTQPQAIPVNHVTLQKKNIENLPDRVLEKASLVLFDFDRAELSDRNQRILGNVAATLTATSRVILRGFTDLSGDEAHNLTLSQRRAESAARALQQLAPAASVRHEGVGETQQLYPNDTPEGRFYCRTVLLLIETLKSE